MFTKARYHTFTDYTFHSDETIWENDLNELKENGFSYIILSRGLDLKTVLASEDQKKQFMAFLNRAAENKLSCVVHAGNPRELYLLPDARRWRIDYIRHVAETLGDHPGVYALLLEESPTGGAQFPIDRWKAVTAEVEGRLEGAALTEDGYLYRLRSWQMEQYTAHVQELVAVVKKSRSRLKTAIRFNAGALYPVDSLVHYPDVSRALDFVIIDASGAGFHDEQAIRRLPDHVASMAVTLTDRDVWMTAGSHTPFSRYLPGLDELRRWTYQLRDRGVCGIGWPNWDDTAWTERYAVRGEPLSGTYPEHWKVALGLSRLMAGQERKKPEPSPYGCLFSYDSLLSRVPWMDGLSVYRTLEESCGVLLRYIPDTRLIGGVKTLKCRTLFTTPCPAARSEVVEALLSFMNQGGWVIASADDFGLNEQLQAGDMRRRLFGVVSESRAPHNDRIRITQELAEIPEGASLAPALIRARLTTLETDVETLGVWGDGASALIRKRHGKGGSVYIGSNPYRMENVEERALWRLFFRSMVLS